MKQRLYRITRMALLCSLAAALPAFAQDYHSRQNDHPEHHQAQRNEHNAGHPQAHHAPAQQHRANTRRPSHRRPPQWGHAPAHRRSYNFRSNDRARLHSYYMARLRAINRANRPVFRVGGYFPYTYIDSISALPPDIYGTMAPPPPGYQMGYYDGYVVVYDPVTYFIASVVDLLR